MRINHTLSVKRYFSPFALLIVFFLGFVPTAIAQQAPTSDLSQSELDQLIKTIEDPEARKAFLQNLKNLRKVDESTITKESLGELLLTALSKKGDQAEKQMTELIEELLQIPAWMAKLNVLAMDQFSRQTGIEILLKLLAILGISYLIELGVRKLTKRLRRRLEEQAKPGLGTRLFFSFLWMLLALLPIAAFGIAGQIILPLTHPRPSVTFIALAMINARLLANGLNILGLSLFMPHAASLRIFRLNNSRAYYLYRWWARFVNISVYSYFFFGLSRLLMLPSGMIELLAQAIGILLTGMALYLIIQNKANVAHKIKAQEQSDDDNRGSALTALRKGVAETWHIIAGFYVLALYVVWVLGLPGGFQFLIRATFWTALIMVVTKLLAELVQKGIKHSFDLSKEFQEAMPGLDDRLNRYLPLLFKIIQTVIYGVALILVAKAWNIPAIEFLSTEIGKKIINVTISILLVISVAMVVWEASNGFINHYLSEKIIGSGPSRRQRLQTLLPLLRNILRLAIFMMASLIVLSEIGINIAPLLAGAGVIGLAIGFGAQTLVKDIITGLFILAEDTIAVGDVVDIDGHEGKVEGITIRTIRIRDEEGAVHTLPYSIIEVIKNKSKDYSNVIVEVPLAKAVDYDKAVEMMENIGKEMQVSPIGPFILSGLEVLGVSKIHSGSMTLRARIRVNPGKQRVVTRALNLALKKAMDRLEISLAN